LVGQGLLVVERIIVTETGRRYSLYRSRFRNVEITSNFEVVSASVEQNENLARTPSLPYAH
jgi:hypothetical protein